MPVPAVWSGYTPSMKVAPIWFSQGIRAKHTLENSTHCSAPYKKLLCAYFMLQLKCEPENPWAMKTGLPVCLCSLSASHLLPPVSLYHCEVGANVMLLQVLMEPACAVLVTPAVAWRRPEDALLHCSVAFKCLECWSMRWSMSHEPSSLQDGSSSQDGQSSQQTFQSITSCKLCGLSWLLCSTCASVRDITLLAHPSAGQQVARASICWPSRCSRIHLLASTLLAHPSAGQHVASASICWPARCKYIHLLASTLQVHPSAGQHLARASICWPARFFGHYAHSGRCICVWLCMHQRCYNSSALHSLAAALSYFCTHTALHSRVTAILPVLHLRPSTCVVSFDMQAALA